MQPTFTFVIPTFNAASYLGSCLSSIACQDYPKDLVEIIVADGGSSDSTLAIASKYEATVIPNKRRLAEFGVQEGVLKARGDLTVVFAADNGLPSQTWLNSAARPFVEHPDISALWGRLAAGRNDPNINKYYALIQNDPFSHFTNQNLNRYLSKARTLGDGASRYFLLDVDPKHPLVWGANGLVYRTEIVRKIWDRPTYLGDNDAFQTMVESGYNKVAYMPTLEIYHHHVRSIIEWAEKWNRDFNRHFLAHKGDRNMAWAFSPGFRKRSILWLGYGAVPFGAIIHSIANLVTDQDWHWIYHGPVCAVQSSIMISAMLLTKEGNVTLSALLRNALR